MTLWKPCFAVLLLAACACAQAQTPDAAQPPAGAAEPASASPDSAALPSPNPNATQPVVQWTLQVIRDGQQIDEFDGTTTVGQARTDTHHHVVAHDVGCKNQPGGSIDLARTLTVSPLQADAAGVTLAIDAQETLEDDDAPTTAEGCTLPPQPRQVAASHPGLRVAPGQWVSWQIVDKAPSLTYRVRASLAPHG